MSKKYIRFVKHCTRHFAVVLLICFLSVSLSGCLPSGASGTSEHAQTLPTAPVSATFQTGEGGFAAEDIPAYSGRPFIKLSGNVPSFTQEEMTTASYELYGELDELGRCTAATACIGQELMPTEEREAISSVKPTGWHLTPYEGIDGDYLFNRCHLIGFQLTGENANEQNLITGTRYMNTEGMLPFEDETAAYIRRTNNHVLYRVTPVFDGDHLIADGVIMEAKSVEDDGKGVCFHVYCYNVQPGFVIDYATGESRRASPADALPEDKEDSEGQAPAEPLTYILNTNTYKFHYPDCTSVMDMKEKNKQQFTGTREEAIALGYQPCGNCKP